MSAFLLAAVASAAADDARGFGAAVAAAWGCDDVPLSFLKLRETIEQRELIEPGFDARVTAHTEEAMLRLAGVSGNERQAHCGTMRAIVVDGGYAR